MGSKLSKVEKNVAKSLERLSILEIKLRKALKDSRAALAGNCSHPQEHVEKYRWEHDNGYGRQTWINGKRCTLCQCICHFPSLDGFGSYEQWSKPDWAD